MPSNLETLLGKLSANVSHYQEIASAKYRQRVHSKCHKCVNMPRFRHPCTCMQSTVQFATKYLSDLISRNTL